ncbi:phage tail tape measure protein [Compostimonas suwonensis]|uniref:TP901 family phage tail tape measure protein n=1 Tax=Compostimonas suwonensis TaxID=1048394 RepID=A0A2M9BW59_9MICO|nr:phage tail tape measure protein [Compostimonas suwonensis]PJJ62180.1 TP901 family phage tail tape measure protein [Compostimonas suwonensis]
MAAEGYELATTWIRVVPTLEGVEKSVADQFVGASSTVEKEGDKAAGRYSKAAKAGLAAAGIGVAAGAAFKGLYDVGATFDDLTDTIRTETGAQGDALDGLVDIAKDVGSTVPAEFDKIGPVVSGLNQRLGLSGDALETVASQYLEAGRILGEDVDIDSTSAAFNAFEISGDGVSTAMDTLFQVSQATGVGLNQLASGAQAVAPAMQTLGFSFEDTVAMVGTFDKAGLNSSAIMASMSKGMVTLAKDGEQPAEAYRRVVGELQGFVDTGDQASALDLASQVFGTKGAAQFVGALQSGVLNMDELMASTGATGDTILGVGEDTADFAEKWQMVMNQAMVAIEPLATAIFTGLGDALTGIMPFLEDIGEWVGDNQGLFGIIAVGVGALAAAFVVLAVTQWAVNAAMYASPVTWIILAVIALVAAIVLLVMNWDTVVNFLTDTWNGFVGWIVGVMEGFAGWWNGVWSGFLGFVTDVWNGFVGWITDGFNLFLLGMQIIGAAIAAWWNGLWQGIADFVMGIWNGIVAFVTSYITTVQNVIAAVGAAIASVWNGIWSGISSFFSGIWDGIIGTINTIRGAFSSAFNGIADIVASAFNGVVNVVRGVINSISSLVNGIIDGINGVAGAVGGAIGIDLSIPNIPMLADGGRITGSGIAIVGENGPELVHLSAGAVVDPDIGKLEEGRVSSDSQPIQLFLDGRLVFEWFRDRQRSLK